MIAIWHWFLQVTGTANTAGRWYGFWSGFGSDIGEVAIIGGLVSMFRKYNCHTPWCFRIGHHHLADGTPICRRHHPDLPNRKRTLAELHAAHHDAVSAGSSPLANG